MAHKLWKDMTLKLDNQAGTLTAITSFVNQASLQGAMELLEDTALGDSTRSFLPGLAGATIPINGFVNSTTDAMFGPLVGARTSITKTVELYDGLKYYNGEVYPTEVQISGDRGTITAFSANLTFDGAVNRTSVALS